MISGINYRGGWKIIPGQDRTHGPVTTTKLTPEELERYNRVQPNGLKKPVRLESGDKIRDRNKKEDTDMKMLPITTEQLLEECKEHGTNVKAWGVIAQKYNLKNTQVRDMIRFWKIKEKLAQENTTDSCETKENTTVDYKEPEKTDEYAIDICPLENFGACTGAICIEPNRKCKAKPIGITMETPEKAERLKLKPKSLISQSAIGFEYDLLSDNLAICYSGAFKIGIPWEDLDALIEDLKEIKEIVG